MKVNNVDLGMETIMHRCKAHIHIESAFCLFLITLFAMPAMTSADDGHRAREAVHPGEPTVLFGANGDQAPGYWTSLAFSHDGKSLVGTVQRIPESFSRRLVPQRDSEVWSFNVTAINEGADESSKPNLLLTDRNSHVEILATPSGTCLEPLLLIRSGRPFGKVEVVSLRVTDSGPEQTLVGEFPIPRNEKMTSHAACSISTTVTPEATFLVLGTGCSDGEYEDGRTSVTWWGDAKAWNLQSGEPCFADAWEGNQVLGVASSADGKFIAVAGGHSSPGFFSGDQYHGRVVCWEQDFKKIRFDLAVPSHEIGCLAFAPDNNSLVTGGLDGTVKWIDLRQGTVVKSMDVASQSGKSLGRVETIAFSPDGSLLAVGAGCWNRGNKWGETFLIDVRDGAVQKVPSSQEEHVITCVAFSPNSKYLAAGGMEGPLKVWRIDSAK